MYLGINLWNWIHSLDNYEAGLLHKITELGFTGVEIPMTSAKLPTSLINELKETGLEVTFCAAMGPGRDISNFDEHIRTDTMDYFKGCIESASLVGAKVFAGPLYAGGGKRHRLDDRTKQYEWELAIKGVQKLADLANQASVKIALEPLNRYRTSVVNTVDQVLDLVKDINRFNVGVHFDTYQAGIEELDIVEAMEKVLQRDLMFHFHACANNRGAPGKGLFPWDAIFDMLLQYDYQGHITMETFAPGGMDSSWAQIVDEADTVAKNGIGYLQSKFSL